MSYGFFIQLGKARVMLLINLCCCCCFLFYFICSFTQARASVEALKAWNISDLPLLHALSSELTVQRENLIYHLGEEWKQLAVWKLPPTKG